MEWPTKIYVEVTTRCNLRCPMCVKTISNNAIPDADMESAVFRRLLPALSKVDTLILNGIGESLLHPELAKFISLAREKMAPGSTIGLQTNGFLLSDKLAQELISRGLSTICLSVDCFDDTSLWQNPEAHSFEAIEKAAQHIEKARTLHRSDFSLGLEIVLTKRTIRQLPDLIEWGAKNGVDYIITSHLILYDQAAESESLFNPHTPQTIECIERYMKKAEAKGVDFFSEVAKHHRFAGTQTDPAFLDLFNQLRKELRSSDHSVNYETFQDIHQDDMSELHALFERARHIAEQYSIDLQLAPLYGNSVRHCPFIDEKTLFISATGEVMPCHFLWHSYVCRVSFEEIQVKKQSFGSITEQSIADIWESKSYRNFRQEAGANDYAPCLTCQQGPCPTLISNEQNYGNDCYGSQVPCGHCHWNLGGVKCL